MITRHNHGNIIWIDVVKPDREDIHHLREEFNLHPILCEDLIAPSLRQKVDSYDNHIYLVLNFPVPHHDRAHAIHEVDFVIGHNFIITARYDAVDPLHHFAKAFQASTILEKNPEINHAGYFLFYMLKKLYESTSIALSLVGERLGAAEEQIFKGKEQKMVQELSHIHRDVLLYNRSLRHHKSMLHNFEDHAIKFFGQEFSHWTGELHSEFLKVDEKLEDRKEMVSALRTTNDSLLAAKTSVAMRALTLASVPIFLSTLLATILMVDTAGSPIHSSPYAFWIILGSVLATLFISYMLLSHRHQKLD